MKIIQPASGFEITISGVHVRVLPTQYPFVMVFAAPFAEKPGREPSELERLRDKVIEAANQYKWASVHSCKLTRFSKCLACAFDALRAHEDASK